MNSSRFLGGPTSFGACESADPALRQLDRFVGTWRMEGRFAGSDENTIKGEAIYRWLPGGFFVEQPRMMHRRRKCPRRDSYQKGTGTTCGFARGTRY